MAVDIQLFYFLNSFAGQTRWLDGAIVFFAHTFPYLVVAAAATLLAYLPYDRRRKIRIVLTTAAGLLLSRGVITELIRFFFHRPRPFSVLSSHALLTNGEWSFPSGHAAFFFALAMAVYLHDKKWGAWFFGAAILIGAARVAAGVHYPSDIAGGAVIGILSAYGVFYIARKWFPAL